MLRIVNWSSFQSYRDRRPPWIRLHKTLLDDYEFQSMSAEARALLPMLWLLASEDEDPVSGLLRDRNEKMSFRLRIRNEVFEKALEEIMSVLDEDGRPKFVERVETVAESQCNEIVTKPYPDRYETVTPETETETETEKRKNTKKKKIALEELSIDHIEIWLTEKRTLGKYLTVDEHRLLEKFKDYCRSNGKRYKDYVAALRNAFEWNEVPKQGENHERPSNSKQGAHKASISERADQVTREVLAEYGIEDGYGENPPDRHDCPPMLRHPEHLRQNAGAAQDPPESDDRGPEAIPAERH